MDAAWSPSGGVLLQGAYFRLFLLHGLPKVVVGLHRQPGAGAAGAGPFQAYGKFGADGGLAVQYPRQGHARHGQAAGRLGDGQIQRDQNGVRLTYGRLNRPKRGQVNLRPFESSALSLLLCSGCSVRRQFAGCAPCSCLEIGVLLPGRNRPASPARIARWYRVSRRAARRYRH